MLNKIKIYTKGEVYTFLGKIKDIWGEVGKYDIFVRPSRSFIVNFEHVNWEDKNKITVGDTQINIGRIYKEETLDRYKQFLRVRR
ncbi:MAG: hypothetical protein ATN35_07270 [Epulopiscium sp. Nele67-Bin004]|nr:MAG: hypothetical protein ATN35_07270 [Epulopiscium sp. Nele67-Bin004]